MDNFPFIDNRSQFTFIQGEKDSIHYDTSFVHFTTIDEPESDENDVIKSIYNNSLTPINQIAFGHLESNLLDSFTTYQIDTFFNPKTYPLPKNINENVINNSTFIIYEFIPKKKEMRRIAFWKFIKISEGSYKIDSLYYRAQIQNNSPSFNEYLVLKEARGRRNGDWQYWNEDGVLIRTEKWSMGKIL